MKLYYGDCFKLMEEIPEKSVDLILSDPPYGITKAKWDKKVPLDLLWHHYNRVIKDNGAIVLFSQMPFTAELVMSNTKAFKYMWIWYKHYARNFLNAKKQPLRSTENICVFYNQQCTYNPKMRKGKMRMKNHSGNTPSTLYGVYGRTHVKNDVYYPADILDFAGVSSNNQYHPTQKPVELLEYLINTYTNKGEIVLDTFMGSGSTGVACVRTMRNFIGIELEKEYYDIAEKRIGDEIDNGFKCNSYSFGDNNNLLSDRRHN